MLNLLQSELFRLRKRPQTWMLLGIAFLLTAMAYAGFVVGARVTSGQDRLDLSEVLTFPELTDFGLTMGLGFFGLVMVIIVSAGLMGNEYSWNTLRPLVARARGRSGLLTAKLLTMVIYTIGFMLVLAALIAVLSLVSSAIAGVDSRFSMDALGDAALYTLKLALAHMPYPAFAFMLATVARSNAAGIAGALGLMFIEQPILQLLGLASDIFESVEEFGIAYNLNSILGFADGNDARAAVIIAVYTALFTAISYVVFLRRDVTSG
jgi:ABC-type transport system involved in multi-copper enzyme maturation permease subunit